MRFDEGLAFFLSAVIGAGIFALPVLASQVSPLYVILALVISLLFSIFLGYSILNFFPGDVEDEVERHLGKFARSILHIINLIIILLALTSYALALELHLKTNIFFLFFLLFVPLFFNVAFPLTFSISFAAFVLIFIGFVSLANLSFLSSIKPATSPIFLPPLLAASYFAFFGHNIIPRVRSIVRKISHVQEIILKGTILVFLLYLPFVLTTSYLGASEVASLLLAKIHPEPLGSIIALTSVIIFYTSFILFGIHLQDMLPPKNYNSLLVVLLVALLYYFVKLFDVSFPILIASAGFAVSIWAFIVSLAAYKSSKRKETIFQFFPLISLFLSSLPFILLIFYH